MKEKEKAKERRIIERKAVVSLPEEESPEYTDNASGNDEKSVVSECSDNAPCESEKEAFEIT